MDDNIWSMRTSLSEDGKRYDQTVILSRRPFFASLVEGLAVILIPEWGFFWTLKVRVVDWADRKTEEIIQIPLTPEQERKMFLKNKDIFGLSNEEEEMQNV